MPWTHKDFANMHYLYGLYDGDARSAAETFKREYEFHKRWGSEQDGPNKNSEDLIFPTAADILRIDKLYSRGELPNENTIAGGRAEGEKIIFSHSEELRRKIRDEYKGDRLKVSKELLKRCEDKNFFDLILWTSIGVVASNHFTGLAYEKLYLSDHDNEEYCEVTTWVGMLGGDLIGPFELPDDVTDEEYAKFLKDDLPELLEDVPQEVKDNMWIHVEDNTSVGDCVKKFLNENYKNRWIGPKGTIHWPIFGWDLNPVRYIWQYVIGEVYENKCDSKEEILERIVIGCDKFNISQSDQEKNEILGTVQGSLLKIWDACVKENGNDTTYSIHLF